MTSRSTLFQMFYNPVKVHLNVSGMRVMKENVNIEQLCCHLRHCQFQNEARAACLLLSLVVSIRDEITVTLKINNSINIA